MYTKSSLRRRRHAHITVAVVLVSAARVEVHLCRVACCCVISACVSSLPRPSGFPEPVISSYRSNPASAVSLFSNCWPLAPKQAPQDAMATLRELQRQLGERLEELRRRDAVIEYLERELADRDAAIRHLRNEIDKFRQVVRPLTQQLTRAHRPNVSATPTRPARTKRQGFSAEPVSRPGDPGYEEPLPLERVDKPEA